MPNVVSSSSYIIRPEQQYFLKVINIGLNVVSKKMIGLLHIDHWKILLVSGFQKQDVQMCPKVNKKSRKSTGIAEVGCRKV